MKAKIESSYSKDRQLLHKVIPLDTPFTVVLEPTTYCNLKCNFCIQSLPKNDMLKNGHIFFKMERQTFETFLVQLKAFPKPIKSIAFIGSGEPLLHEDLPYMIQRLKESHVVERVTVVTNGTLLSQSLSSALINAGLDVLKISVNGLCADDYLKTCGVKIDFDKYVSEIAWLYENKGKMSVLIKTLDTALGEKTEYDFYHIFGNYCDEISIENTLTSHPGVPYEQLNLNHNKSSIYAGVKNKPDVCSALFYILFIRANGKVHLCCNAWYAPTDESMYIQKRSLYELWNSKEHQQAMLNILQKKYEGLTTGCKECPSKNVLAYAEDYLDPYVSDIYNRIIAMEDV